jgi:hypothetical protein
MFEPTQGCPHLQPLELISLAEKTAIDSSHPQDARTGIAVEVIEITPNHMFRVIKTQMKWNGQTWLVSNIDRLLEIGDAKAGARIIKV